MALCFRVWELFVLTLVLQIGMLPLLANEFHRMTFAGTLVNFAAVPLTAIIVPLGFCALITGLLWPEDSGMAGVIGDVNASSRSAEVRAFTAIELSRASHRLGDDYFPNNLGGYRNVLRVRFAGRKAMIWSLQGVLAATGLVIAVHPFSPRIADGKLEVTVLDVGEGDSLFVVSAAADLLIDGAERLAIPRSRAGSRNRSWRGGGIAIFVVAGIQENRCNGFDTCASGSCGRSERDSGKFRC